jgi:hypothetical protein
VKLLPTTATLAATMIVLAGCSSTPPAHETDPARDLDHAPAWVTASEDEAPVLWSIGTASGIDDPYRLQRTALADARARMASRIADCVAPALTPDLVADRSVCADFTEAVVSINLHGPHRERYWVAPSGTCYVRYEISLETYEANVLSLHRVDEDVRATVAAAARNEVEATPMLAR